MGDQHFVAISVIEFVAWYRYGELRLALSRFVPVSVDANGALRDLAAAVEVLDRSPQVLHDEEHDILIARMLSSEKLNPSLQSRRKEIVYEPLDNIDELIPMSDRAARILAVRLEIPGMKLGEPIFEVIWTQFREREVLRSAKAGGKAAVSLALGDATDFKPPDGLILEVENGIHLRVWSKLHGEAINPNAGVSLFQYERPLMAERKPRAPIGNDLDYLVDLGHMARAVQDPATTSLPPAFETLKTLVSDRKKKKSPRNLVEILADQEIQKTLCEIRDTCPVSSASPIAIVIFLKWREAFRGAAQVDLERLRADAVALEGVGMKDACRDALFLLGGFVGREAFAPFMLVEMKARLEQATRIPADEHPNDPGAVELPQKEPRTTGSEADSIPTDSLPDVAVSSSTSQLGLPFASTESPESDATPSDETSPSLTASETNAP